MAPWGPSQRQDSHSGSPSRQSEESQDSFRMTAKGLQSKSAWLTVQGEWGTASGSLEETGLGSPTGSWCYPPRHPPPRHHTTALRRDALGEVERADAWGQVEERGAF